MWKLFLLFATVVAFADAQQNLRLLQIQVIARHGSRTPLFKSALDFSEGGAQLTIRGIALSRAMGEILRQRYILDPTTAIFGVDPQYNFSSIQVRSTDTDRTLNTAQAYMLGFFPPTPKNVTTVNGNFYQTPLDLQFVPIHTTSQDYDQMLRGWLNCPALMQGSRRCTTVQRGRRSAMRLVRILMKCRASLGGLLLS
eukprot:Colp12_sorted_trinity150504_noHs@8276